MAVCVQADWDRCSEIWVRGFKFISQLIIVIKCKRLEQLCDFAVHSLLQQTPVLARAALQEKMISVMWEIVFPIAITLKLDLFIVN
jgi:hypothetical protein